MPQNKNVTSNAVMGNITALGMSMHNIIIHTGCFGAVTVKCSRPVFPESKVRT